MKSSQSNPFQKSKLSIFVQPSRLAQLTTATAIKRPLSDSATTSQPQKKSKIDEEKTAAFTENIVKMIRYGKYNFMVDSDGYVHVYTDGACENNGKSSAVAGLGVYFGEGHAL